MSKSSSGGGIGFLGALAILFIGLKLGGVIHWHWLWVLCPLWVMPAIVLVFIGAVSLYAAIAMLFAGVATGIGYLISKEP